MLVNQKVREERTELVLNNVKVMKEIEENRINNIKKRLGDPLACIRGCGNFYEFKASECLIFHKDIETFKQYIYIYAKLRILGSETRGFFRGENLNFFGMLMSNNREILDFAVRNIDIIAYEEKKDEYQKSKSYRFLSRTILLAIKGEWEDVIRRSNMYLENSSKSSYDKYKYLEFEFLKALGEKDVEKMKETLSQMLDKKVAKKMLNDISTAFGFYLHIYVLIYVKIAMLHGFDLGIDNEIAPKELIDIAPAKEYPEPYEFMKKFDFNTISPEEWKAWIYEYHPEPKELEKEEEEGYFI